MVGSKRLATDQTDGNTILSKCREPALRYVQRVGGSGGLTFQFGLAP